METITTQGVAISRLGFGTFRMPGADAQPVVESADSRSATDISTPLRCTTTKPPSGAAIAASGVNRNELFITNQGSGMISLRRMRSTRVRHQPAEAGARPCRSLMIHWPSQDMEWWRRWKR